MERRSLMMEDKQLDFNRPLISIRRPTTTQTSEPETKTRSFDSVTKNKNPPPPSSPPVYKSDIKSGPVRNPGTVPFQWEYKPGKPKIERESVLTGFVEPPKLPPGRVIKGNSRLETKANVQTKTVSNVVEDVKSYSSRYDDDDNDDGNFLDANDRLSRTESFFYNCSNVSGVDGQGILVEPFGTLSSDRQTQDLMMGRFLPAAKALTSEAHPPHLTKKPPKSQEPPRQVMKKVVPVKEKQNKGEISPYRFNHSRSDSQEEEDGDMSSMASGVCGIIPQICLRSSFGLLNPVPSVRLQAQRAVSVRRMRSKYQDSTTCNEKHQNKQTSETVSEDKRKLKLNESVAQGPSLPEGKEKPSKNFGELLASDDDNTWEPLSEDHVAEKTLYVDTVHSVDKKVQEEYKECTSLDVVDPVKDVQESIRADEEAILQPKTTEQMKDNNEFSSLKECDDQAIVAVSESNVTVENTEEKIDLEVQLQRNRTNLESSRHHHHIVPPPPLPKAPSDSWLKRTLPTIPSKKNSFTWLQQSLGSDDNQYFTNKIQANPKWETMVKTSNTQQGFVCFSKEALNTIPEA